MILADVFERFVEKTPVSVMARAAMEHALAPDALDALFEEQTDKQYTRELLFSSVVDLMGVVVGKVAPSVHGAYQAVADTLPVSSRLSTTSSIAWSRLSPVRLSITRRSDWHP